MPGSITATGVGGRDNWRNIGSVSHINRLERMGSIDTIGRIGTLNKIGSIDYIARIGSLSYQAALGTVNGLAFSPKRLLGTNSVHTATGSTYTGSWEDIAKYRTKTYQVFSSMGGSLHIVTGAVGTGPSTGFTGTAYKLRIGAGSAASASFTESFSFARANIRSGSVGSGKGTLRLTRSFRSI